MECWCCSPHLMMRVVQPRLMGTLTPRQMLTPCRMLLLPLVLYLLALLVPVLLVVAMHPLPLDVAASRLSRVRVRRV